MRNAFKHTYVPLSRAKFWLSQADYVSPFNVQNQRPASVEAELMLWHYYSEHNSPGWGNAGLECFCG